MSDERTTTIRTATNATIPLRPGTALTRGRRASILAGSVLASMLIGACGSSPRVGGSDDASVGAAPDAAQEESVGSADDLDIDGLQAQPDAVGCEVGTADGRRTCAGAGGSSTSGDVVGDEVGGSVAAARREWGAENGRSYLLVVDVESEGLSGTYCTVGIAGDPAHATDASGTGAAGPLCAEAEPFVAPPATVEQLHEWAAVALTDGGRVEIGHAGVPTSIDGAGIDLRVIEFAFDVTEGTEGPPAAVAGPREALGGARALWAQASPPEYVWLATFSAEGLTETRCIDHAPASGTVSGLDDPGCVDGLTVPETFAAIEEAIDEGAAVQATYDSADGHPVTVTASYPTGDGWDLRQDSYDVPE